MRHLSRRSSIAIEVQSAQRQILASMFDWVVQPVGEGEFTVTEDVNNVGGVLKSLVRDKLLAYLSAGDLHNYRTILNLQSVIFRNLNMEPVLDMIPGFQSSSSDPCQFFVDEFMYQNGFTSMARDPWGWTRLCYAALAGSALLLCGLLQAKADVNDKIQVRGPQIVNLAHGTTVLSLCAFLKHNEALKVLLSARANADVKDSFGGTAMQWAAGGHNPEGAQAFSVDSSKQGFRKALGCLPRLCH